MAPQNFQLDQFLPYLLNQAAEASSLAFQREYKGRYGMLRTEWRVLFHLGLYGQLTASDIAARAVMHKTKISRAVQRLAEKRFVTRTRDQDDRRVEHLSLTPKGQRAYEDLQALAQRYDDALTAGLSDQEGAVLRAALVKLQKARDLRFT